MKRTLPIFVIAAVLVAGCGSEEQQTQTQKQVAQTQPAPAATTSDSTTGPDLIKCASKEGLEAEDFGKRSIAVASIKPDLPEAKIADVRLQTDAAPGREIHAYVVTNGDIDKIKVSLDGFATTQRYGNVLVDYSNSKAEFSPKAEACLPS